MRLIFFPLNITVPLYRYVCIMYIRSWTDQ